MNRFSALLAGGLLLMAVPAAVLGANQTFKADLSGGAEVPPVTVDGTGKATVTIASDEKSVSWDVTYSGLTGDAAAGHIHFGSSDVSGPVMIPFATVGMTGSKGTFESTDYAAGAGLPADWAGVLKAIRGGNAYVNIHTAANAPGEIRGQLKVVAGTPATDTVSGSTQTPSPLPIGLVVVGLIGLAVGVRRFSLR